MIVPGSSIRCCPPPARYSARSRRARLALALATLAIAGCDVDRPPATTPMSTATAPAASPAAPDPLPSPEFPATATAPAAEVDVSQTRVRIEIPIAAQLPAGGGWLMVDAVRDENDPARAEGTLSRTGVMELSSVNVSRVSLALDIAAEAAERPINVLRLDGQNFAVSSGSGPVLRFERNQRTGTWIQVKTK